MTEFKKCTKCLEEKMATEEFFYKGNNLGLRAKCKKCTYIEMKEHRNRSTFNKKYYEKNTEYCLKINRINQFKNKTGIGLVY